MSSLAPKNNIICYWYFDKNDLDSKGNPKRKAEALKHPLTGDPLRPSDREDMKIAKKLKEEKDYLYKYRRVSSVSYTIEQAKEDFFKERRLEMSKSYKQVFDAVFIHLGKVIPSKTFVTDVNKEHINLFRELLGEGHNKKLVVSHNTRVTYLRHLKIFFKWLADKDIGIDMKMFPKYINYEDTEIKYIEPFVMKSILGFLKARSMDQYRLIFFLNDNGFRPEEALHLKKEQVNFEKKYIWFHNRKGKRYAPFPLSEESEKLLKEIIAEHKALKIKSDKFFQYSINGLDFFPRLVKAALKPPAEGKKPHPLHGIINERFVLYDIRKTFATDLAASTDDIFYVMKLMRHRDIRTTEKYYAIPRVQKMRGEMEKLRSSRDNEYETVKQFRKANEDTTK